MEVRQLCSGAVISISAEATIRETAVLMNETGVGSLAVMDDSDFIGIFTERDLLHAVAGEADLNGDPILRWMTDRPDCFSGDMSVSDTADWIVANGYRYLPVVEDGLLIGMASIKDVLWALTDPEERRRGGP